MLLHLGPALAAACASPAGTLLSVPAVSHTSAWGFLHPRATKNLTPTTSLLAPEFSTSPRFTQSQKQNPDDSQSSPAQFGPHFCL